MPPAVSNRVLNALRSVRVPVSLSSSSSPSVAAPAVRSFSSTFVTASHARGAAVTSVMPVVSSSAVVASTTSTTTTTATATTSALFDRSLRAASASRSVRSFHAAGTFGWFAALAAAAATAGGFAIWYSTSSPSFQPVTNVSFDVGAPSGLDPKEFVPFTVSRIERYNHDSFLLTLKLASPDSSLNLPVSSFVLAKFTNAEGKDVIRPYTPIYTRNKGELVLLVKVYKGAQMGSFLESRKPGDQVLLKGPLTKLQYSPNFKKHLGFVIGGSGITPALQVIEEVVSNPSDHTKLTLLFANHTPADILLRERIDELAAKHKNLKVVYFIDKKTPGFVGEFGHINADSLKRLLPPPSNDTLIYVCGPAAFYASISGTKAPDFSQGELDGALKQLGYTKEQVFKF